MTTQQEQKELIKQNMARTMGRFTSHAGLTGAVPATQTPATPEQQLQGLKFLRFAALLEVCLFPWIMLAVLPMALGGHFTAEPPYLIFKDTMGATMTAAVMVFVYFSGMVMMVYCDYVEKKLREQLGLTQTDKSNPITRNGK